MNYQMPKRVVLKILSLLILLTACAQEPNYAPVQTVNQEFEPNNGYYLRNKPPINPGNQPDTIQQSTKNLPKQQEGNPVQQNLNANGKPDPSLIQNTPSKIRSNGQATKKETVKVPGTSEQTIVNQNPRTQSPSPDKTVKTSKNKSANTPVDKAKPSKSQKLAMLDQKLADHSSNKPILSNIKDSNAQKNQHSDTKSLDNIQVTGKNNKKLSISIDNKKVLKLNFQWPLQGRLSRNFSQTDNKGILIKGKSGQEVHAAEAGKAVYCGHGLAGFGNLVIIKHNETYLSAYANNSKLTVKEGERVEKGQTIGQVGLTGLKKSSLHFEIRKNGKPINPLAVLPKL